MAVTTPVTKKLRIHFPFAAVDHNGRQVGYVDVNLDGDRPLPEVRLEGIKDCNDDVIDAMHQAATKAVLKAYIGAMIGT